MFKEGYALLLEAGRLGAILKQFPWSFEMRCNRSRSSQCLRPYPGYGKGRPGRSSGAAGAEVVLRRVREFPDYVQHMEQEKGYSYRLLRDNQWAAVQSVANGTQDQAVPVLSTKAVGCILSPSFNDTQEDFDAESIQDLAEAHLQRLGLARLRHKRPGRNEVPEFDENTGALKGSGQELTSLGRLLLRRIGLATDQDF